MVNAHQFIVDPKEYLVKNIRDACAWNNNPRAKRKSLDTTFDLMYKCVSADF